MKYSYNWLKKIFSSEKTDNGSGRIVVGQILEILKHPNADRLQLVKVDTGQDKLDIVCGASNIQVGDKVPVALVGAKLPASPAGGPSGLEIKAAEIRGVKSNGMLCAEDELGLGADHSGIMILKEDAQVGMEFAKYVNLNK